MKKNIINILLLIIYGLPFAFISMYCDFKQGTILGYVVMILSYIYLVYMCKLNNKNIIFLGNFISLLSSYLFVNSIPYDAWGYYFKPLTPIQLLILISILNILLQLFIIKLINKK